MIPVSLLHRSAHANSGAFNFLSKMAKKFQVLFSLSGPVFQPLRAIKDKRKRGDVFDDSLCANGWRWEWVSVEHEIKCHGEVVRRERVRCSCVFANFVYRGSSMRGEMCNKQVQHGNRGLVALTDHLPTKSIYGSLQTLKTISVCQVDTDR
jgi:hypothetical protein